MPTSNLYVWPELLALVDQVPHAHVLDVGPGHGKAATLLREYLNHPPARIDAVEVHKPYVDAFGLSVLYDHVLVGDALELNRGTLATYDVVLIADVIEHFDLEAAIEWLAIVEPRVVVSTPVEFFHNGDGLPDSETHRSHWTDDVWQRVAAIRPVEVKYQTMGGWLVRLGPLA